MASPGVTPKAGRENKSRHRRHQSTGQVGATDPLVGHTPQGWTPWTVADRNHDAAARVLGRSGWFSPQEVSLAVRPNPVLDLPWARPLGTLW